MIDLHKIIDDLRFESGKTRMRPDWIPEEE